MRQVLSFWILGCVSLAPLSTASAAPPNIVFVLADDLGYGDVRCFGGERCQIDTPHFDRLAQEGVRFTNAYANASVCVPTRMSLMTGRYAWRFGRPQRGGPWGFLGLQLPTEQRTLGDCLQSAGYQTAYIGKWHLGTTMQTHDGQVQGPTNVNYQKPLQVGPKDYGFTESFILPGSLDMYPYAYVHNHHWVGSVTATKGWSAFNRRGPAAADFEDTEVLNTWGERAEAYLAEYARGAGRPPFFLYVALTAPHTPTSPSESFRGRSPLGIYGDFVMETDHCLGRILAALDEHQLGDNTLVIATSDHGPALYAGRTAAATPNQLRELEREGHHSGGPFRGYKFSAYDGGLHVPFVARLPGVTPPGTTCKRLIGLPDLYATVAEISGARVAEQECPDSLSFAELLKHPQKLGKRDSLLLQSTQSLAVIEGPWKLLFCPGSGCLGRYGNLPASGDAWRAARATFGRPVRNREELLRAPFVQLFHLPTDPGEQRNLALSRPDKVASLAATARQLIVQGRTTVGPRADSARSIPLFRSVPDFVWE